MNRVGIFWDYENCAPPAGTPGYVVAERLRTACGVHGSVTQFRAYLELSVPQATGPSSQPSHLAGADPSLNDLSCPSTSLKNLTLRSELQSSGVSLIDCPHNSRKNVADSMLACDLVCFALDNPAVPQIPYANYIPASPFSIPNTPFSAVSPPTISLSKTTIVLISGDRDFAYPLAVLKARKYDVGLIVPPGGAHPALRAQANWVMNWKDLLEGTNALDGSQTATTSARGPTEGVDGLSNVPSAPGQNVRRSSFTRRGSVSGPRRGSVSAPTLSPAPPPPSIAESVPKASTLFAQPPPIPDFHDVAPATAIQRPPPPLVHPSPSEGPSTSQLPSSSKLPRKSTIRRVAKTTSRPPSRPRSRAGGRSARAERAEPEAPKATKSEQLRPQPIIVPVPLTASPVGSVGQSFAGMSPRTHGRPHTPPLFSTNPASPPPPAAPPALAPPPTPPAKALTPPIKPSTPPRDAARPPHRPPIPHVATPRPPVPGSHHSTSANDQAVEGPSLQNAPTPAPELVAPAPALPPKPSMLQSLLPAAPALCPNTTTNSHRPPLTVPSLSIQTTSTNTLTPATPVTPPASPPFRTWARLQPVHDDTDGDGDRASSVNKKLKKGKEKAKEKTELGTEDSDMGAQHAPKAGRGPSKLAVQVGLLVKTGEEPSAISGVDSILRSYAERTPNVEWDSRTGVQDDQTAPAHSTERNDESVQAANLEEERDDGNVEDDDEEEEKFHETFFATFSRSHPVQVNAPRTPPTVKVPAMEFTSGNNSENVQSGGEGQRSRHSTPRPMPRSSHSMPTIPMIQSLLGGMEGNMPESRADSRGANGIDDASNDMVERVYSRANSPPALPRRTTSLTTTIDLPKVSSSVDLCVSPSVGSTYREFRFLINVLERWRRNGHDHPLRSLIGVEFSPDIFAQVGATSFKDYVQRAVAAGVVTVGGGAIQGREWISLNRQWQGLGLVIE